MTEKNKKTIRLNSTVPTPLARRTLQSNTKQTSRLKLETCLITYRTFTANKNTKTKTERKKKERKTERKEGKKKEKKKERKEGREEEKKKKKKKERKEGRKRGRKE